MNIKEIRGHNKKNRSPEVSQTLFEENPKYISEQEVKEPFVCDSHENVVFIHGLKFGLKFMRREKF